MQPATIHRELAERSLAQFIRLHWNTLEPGRVFVPGYAVEAICEHLEAVTNGQITRLLINVPPGCMKSLTTDVFWPAWEWGPRNLAHLRYVSFSYSQALTIRDNERTRALIGSREYQQHWGDRFQVNWKIDNKIKFSNDKMGWKLATSVGGLGTGERGDRIIIDDPHNVVDGESEAIRASTLQWFTESLPTRVNDADKSAMVCIMQRVHAGDVSGLIIAKELGWELLCLPMEYEPARKCTTSIGFTDPRERDGELLWPQRFSEEALARMRKVMGSYAWSGQMQQSPSPREGGMFKRHHFEVIGAVPAGNHQAVRKWDLAATVETGLNDPDWTVGLKMVKTELGFHIVTDVVRFRGTPAQVENAIRSVATQDGTGCLVHFSQDPGQAGKAQAGALVRMLAGFRVKAEIESGDKATRATPFAAQAEAGNVKLLRGAWTDAFLDEIETFPNGHHDDQVDAAAGAFNALNETRRTFGFG